MENTVLLNNVTHKDLKINTTFSEDYGDNQVSAVTFPTEFADVEKEYPILFFKDVDRQYYRPMVLMGFEQGENLFLEGNSWNARYVPAVVARGPFLVGFQNRAEQGEEEKQEPVIHVDMNHPRVNQDIGEAVFLEHGGNSSYITRISKLLHRIHDGMVVNEDMCRMLDELELFEPVSIGITLVDGSQNQLAGYYTIHAEKLRELKGEALEVLNLKGYLSAAHLAISSLGNINKLIEIKNSRLKKV